MATATKDYYDVLGVSRDASHEEIRKAYLKLAHKYHPDKTGGDKAAEEKLKEINQAYDTLKNPEKRAQYDQMTSGAGAFGFGGEGFMGGFDGFDFSGEAGSGSGFEDVLSSIFGDAGTRWRSSARPGDDLEVKVAISLEESYTGTSRNLKIPRQEVCSECHGRRHAPGYEPQVCPECNGTGQMRRTQGAFQLSVPCARCKGTGRIVTHPCPRCKGSGRVRLQRELAVNIPAGADTGTHLRLAGEGEPGENGGPRGDLYVQVVVEPHELFTREGDDIVCEVPVTLPQAALGAKIRVPTIDGMAQLNVPEGTQNGTLLRMRGLGLPPLGTNRRGDQIVRILAEIPRKLSKKQRELIAQFDASSTPGNYPKISRFSKKLKRP